MNLHSITDLSNKHIISVLEAGLAKISEQDLAQNYHPFYQNESSNLFYLLKQGRYQKGNYYVLEKDGMYVGSAGWNHYTDNTALVLTRAYIVPKYRTKNLMSEYFLPRIFSEASGYEKLWITCNDYNKSIYNGLVKLSKGQSAGWVNTWPEIYKNFKPIGSRLVNNTPQYIAEYQK